MAPAEDPGASLHAERLAPAGSGPERGRVVLVHGFTQTGRSWLPIARQLAAGGYEVLLPDLPGHGGSLGVAADLPAGARLLGEAGGRAAYAGYSMGARLCLHLALARPELVERLVLLSGTAGIEGPARRAARRRADEALADSLERPGGPSLEEFLSGWLARPLFATLAPEAAGVADRLRNSPAGLAQSLRLAGTGAQEPLWDRLGELEMPVLVVAGGADPAFAAHARRMAAAIGGRAELAVLPGAGHAVGLEQPEAVAAALLAFVGDDGNEHRAKFLGG